MTSFAASGSDAPLADAVLVAEPTAPLSAPRIGTVTIDAGDRIVSCDAAAVVLRRCAPGAAAATLGLHLATRLRSAVPERWIDSPPSLGRAGLEMLLAPLAAGSRTLYLIPLDPLVPAAGREAFLARMDGWMRPGTDPDEALRRTCEELGRHLGVSRVGFGEIEDEGRIMRVGWDWTDRVASMVGRHSIVEDSVTIRAHRRGESVITDDMRGFPDVSAHMRASLDHLQIVASASIPLRRDGAWVALISAMHRLPRQWRDEEIQLIADVGERCWTALAHARALAQVEETEGLLRTIVAHAPIGVHVRDEEGATVLANAAAAISDAEAEPFAAAAAAGGELVERRCGDRWTLSTRFAVPTSAGSARLVAGFDVDITAQKQAEADLERSREALHQTEKLSALGSLLAGVSHELNNPLSIVIAQSELLEMQAADTPLAERARKVRVAGERCGRIVQTFLAMARQRPPQRTRVDLNTVAANALELLDYSLRTSGVRVVRDLAGSLPPVSADPDQLHQVLTNLLVNAQQAMAESGGSPMLHLSTKASDGAVLVEVADSGPGVKPDNRRRIFEPFFTDKPQGKGTGLGLSFSRGVVEAHGGTLTLVDEDGGATFRMSLPVMPEATERPIAAAASTRSVKGRSALLVDDEPDVADALADFLRLEGFRCETAVNGIEARLLLSQHSYDLVVSDLRMPDMDGPALFGWIAANRPALIGRTVFATGDTLGQAAARFLADCGRPYIEKPFTPGRLRRLIQELDVSA